MVDLREYISEDDEVTLIVNLVARDERTRAPITNDSTRHVRKYKVTKVYPHICMCQDRKGKKRVAGIGDLVMSHSLILPNNPLELINIEEER